MAKQSKTLQLMSLKLGLSDEERVISKAAEFERLLQMKSTANNITDTAKVVICLDLAATIFKVDFDQKVAIKCSGLKSPSYMNCRKIVENVLELNTDQLSVTALCLMLQCNVQDLAERILNEFKKAAKIELDMSLPQYVCMAVYQACRISKVKVSKSKMIDKSQLKSSQWTKLDAEWLKFTDEKFSAFVKKKRGRPAKNTALDADEKMEVDEEVVMNKKEESTEPQIEAYEDWKRRILGKAYREIEKLNKENQIKPKSTPSKTKETSNKQNTRSDAIKLKYTPSKQKDSPSKQKDSPNKQKDSPNKQKDSPNKQKDSPNEQTDTPNKQKDSPNKQKDSPNKQKDAPNKQKDILNGHNEILMKECDIVFSPRKSPRKTPRKYEPYQSPVKNKGVRLLFPA